MAPKLTTHPSAGVTGTTAESPANSTGNQTTSSSNSTSSRSTECDSEIGLAECPECGSNDFESSDGNRYCTDCGAVVSGQAIERSEPSWRDISDRRLGPGQSTQWVNTGSTTTQGPGSSARFFRYNDRLNNNERSLVRGLREVRSLSAKLELPSDMRERAAYWYRNVVEQELLQGRSIEGFAAAAVYVAARERHYPVTIDGLAEFCPGSAQDIRHHMSVLNSEFSVTIQPAEPKDFLPSIISKLPVAQTVEYRTNQLIESVMENGYHVGKHPAAIAATAVYAVANDEEEDIKQETVAAVADISKVTVSRHHQEISEILS